jgi:hypothetical protein
LTMCKYLNCFAANGSQRRAESIHMTCIRSGCKK